jgi:hypothetical protein
MSLISDLKSFVSRIETAFVKLFKKSPTVLQLAQGVVTYASPVILGLEAELAPAAESETANVLSTIKADLATLSASATAVNGSSTAAQAVSNLQAQVPALLAATKVENPSLVSKVEGVVNILGPELAALLTALA